MGLTVPSWSSVGDDKTLLSIPQTSKKKTPFADAMADSTFSKRFRVAHCGG